jgi:hypothetical protein
MDKRYFFLVLFFLLPGWVTAQLLTVVVEGDANFNQTLIPVREAGTDYASVLEAVSSVYISVLNYNELGQNQNSNERWSVYLHKSDTGWDDQLLLEARRSGDGYNVNNQGNPNIHDGINYQPLSDNQLYFFRGRGEIASIPVSLRLSGFSVTMGAGDFETNLVFTVYDNW